MQIAARKEFTPVLFMRGSLLSLLPRVQKGDHTSWAPSIVAPARCTPGSFDAAFHLDTRGQHLVAAVLRRLLSQSSPSWGRGPGLGRLEGVSGKGVGRSPSPHIRHVRETGGGGPSQDSEEHRDGSSIDQLVSYISLLELKYMSKVA